jgi:hypothetical protein
VTLVCAGVNAKNDYDRETPCDQDSLRNMARQTDAAQVQSWFTRDVVGLFTHHPALDAEGIFIGDATDLFVPDNRTDEDSSRLLFDEHHHPVESEHVTAHQRARCRWRRCDQLVSLMHTNREGECFLHAGVAVTPGQAHESPSLYRLVEPCVAAHGTGVMQRRLVDRGVLDGPAIGRCKTEWGIDGLIPAQRNLDVVQDVVGLATAGRVRFAPWARPPGEGTPIPVHRPENVRQREHARQRPLATRQGEAQATAERADRRKIVIRSEVAVVREVRTASRCPIPLTVIVNREGSGDGHQD